MALDRVQLLVGQLQGERQQQPLRRGVGARELRQDRLVEHPLVRRVLVHDDDALGRLVDDVGVEHLEQRRLEARVGAAAVVLAARRPPSARRARRTKLRATARRRDAGMRRRQRAPVAHRRRGHQRAQRVAHRLLDHALDADPVAKADLELGRVHVDVHVLGRDLDARDSTDGRSPG